jgi:hypothetical protein
VGEVHDTVIRILEATSPDEAVAVVDVSEGFTVLAERLPERPTAAKIHVLGAGREGHSADGPSAPPLSASEALPALPRGSTHPDPSSSQSSPSRARSWATSWVDTDRLTGWWWWGPKRESTPASRLPVARASLLPA